MYNADPVCSKSPDHHVIEEAIQAAKKTTNQAKEAPLVFRNSKASKQFFS